MLKNGWKGDPSGGAVMEGFSVKMTSKMKPERREAIHVKSGECSIPESGNGNSRGWMVVSLVGSKNKKDLFPRHELFSPVRPALTQLSDISLNLTSFWRLP